MKKQFKLSTLAIIGAAMLFITSCKKDEETPVVQEGIERAELTFTEVDGHAHGDHFHDLADKTGVTPIVVKFNNKGAAISGGHMHIEADAIYKIQLKAWDYTGKEVQNDFIANKATADNYKAFLVGGNFTLNANTTDESGAIFQPRETTYGDGTAVSGTGGIGTTGILSYFTVGHGNEGATKEVSFILRKVNAGVKANITRNDWNRTDYATAFGGQDVLKLNLEIHAEEGHGH
ncbi:hypothetical protein [Pedobacter xixiisoli]|uniref:Uncharacterized protein n=1 Tax=Pedobacter xixiisoli TaxID=1476464 RepID=A0A285ZUI9_9SPHI|nr:hypothetical protein [Pedobacter xixiisoli]SOD13296.1 hypothetical protein SAMN06297358_1123 [Pedobacter xixiisoli]